MSYSGYQKRLQGRVHRCRTQGARERLARLLGEQPGREQEAAAEREMQKGPAPPRVAIHNVRRRRRRAGACSLTASTVGQRTATFLCAHSPIGRRVSHPNRKPAGGVPPAARPTRAHRPKHQPRGRRRRRLLSEASDSQVRLQVTADRVASKHIGGSVQSRQSRASNSWQGRRTVRNRRRVSQMAKSQS